MSLVTPQLSLKCLSIIKKYLHLSHVKIITEDENWKNFSSNRDHESFKTDCILSFIHVIIR